MNGYKKGQITLVNLFGFFLTLFVWTILAPLISDAIAPVTAYYVANPTSITPAIIVLCNLVPFVVLLAIILSILNTALPPREHYGP